MQALQHMKKRHLLADKQGKVSLAMRVDTLGYLRVLARREEMNAEGVTVDAYEITSPENAEQLDLPPLDEKPREREKEEEEKTSAPGLRK